MERARRYQLVRNIASGGMAQVYEAELVGDSGFVRRVAVKRVLPQYSQDPSMRRMFLDEARVVSQLHHGNIVQVIDFGVVDDCEFIAMEYVDGVDAARAVARAVSTGDPMPDGVALHVVAEAAYALDYAHRRADEQQQQLGIIHRDVSPQNVLLSWQGDVKLGDFGIALSRYRSELTRTGVVKGKGQFMPPEQAFADRDLTPAVDVYALGVTLQVLILGQSGLPAQPGKMVVSPRLWSPVAELVRACTEPTPASRPTAAVVAERAGKLAAGRLGRDGRSALLEWLQPLRSFFGRQSKLDDLMGLSLVAVGPHAFTVSREVAPATRLDRPTPGRPIATRTSDGPVVEQRRTRRLALVLSAAGAIAAGLVAAGVALWPTTWPGSRPAPGPDRGSSAVVQPGPDARIAAIPAQLPKAVDLDAGGSSPDLSAARPVADEASAGGEAGPAAAGRAGSAPAAKVRRRPAAGARRAEHSKRSVTGASRAERQPVVETRAYGWLRVGGGALVGGQVQVDGQAVGYAPLERRVEAGARQVTVRVSGSGRLLLERTVVVGQHNSRANPVRLIEHEAAVGARPASD